MNRIIFATGNAGKMKEIREILGDMDAEILSMKEAGIQTDIVENGTTFEENARIKAKAVAQFTKDIPDGSSLALQQALKNVPDEAYPSIVAIQTKSPVTVILLSIFLGGLGVDRFYIGDIGLGVAKLLLGWLTFGIWPLIDIFLCYKKAKEYNYQKLTQAIVASSN